MDEETAMGCLVVLGIIGIVLFLVLAPFVHLSSLGSGNHSGYVTAVDQRGYIFRNYTVYFKTDNSSSQEDVYCVRENETAKADALRVASKNRQRVTLNYRGVRGFGLGLCDNAEVVSIEIDK